MLLDDIFKIIQKYFTKVVQLYSHQFIMYKDVTNYFFKFKYYNLNIL